jgi:hypothetical protein
MRAREMLAQPRQIEFTFVEGKNRRESICAVISERMTVFQEGE